MSVLNRVLVIDDEASIRESLEMFLSEKGLSVRSAGLAEEGFRLWRTFHPQVIILDIRLPDCSGLDLLKRLTSRDPDVKVIMITAHHDMATTIEAMRQGAYDYIHKPLDVDEFDQAVDKALHSAEATVRTRPILKSKDEEDPKTRIVGSTPELLAIFKTIGRLSRNQATVLIQGETGTGKELIARVIHENSDFKDEPFVTVDCTTLVESLLESELFGHEKGAFTSASEAKTGWLELAGEGTIFFDEIGDLPLSLQAKLLRFLEERRFTRVGGTRVLHSLARIIAATNQELTELVRQGRFRSDLLFRLKVIGIKAPPLRQRIEDLPALLEFFLNRINQELNTRVTRVEAQVLSMLKAYTWPGNVRELKNLLIKAVLKTHGSVLLADTIQQCLGGLTIRLGNECLSTLEEVEKAHIQKTLRQMGWNISATAKALGVSRPTLRKRLKSYRLSPPTELTG